MIRLIVLIVIIVLFAIMTITMFCKKTVSISRGCSGCKWCEYLNKYDNGLPVVYCKKSKCEIKNMDLERPIGIFPLQQFCDDYEPIE